VGAYTLSVSLAFWLTIKYTIGLRVSKQEEIEGLDLGEHGQEAYVGFAQPISRAVEVA
jgi:Amt family ammonium transporter